MVTYGSVDVDHVDPSLCYWCWKKGEIVRSYLFSMPKDGLESKRHRSTGDHDWVWVNALVSCSSEILPENCHGLIQTTSQGSFGLDMSWPILRFLYLKEVRHGMGQSLKPCSSQQTSCWLDVHPRTGLDIQGEPLGPDHTRNLRTICPLHTTLVIYAYIYITAYIYIYI